MLRSKFTMEGRHNDPRWQTMRTDARLEYRRLVVQTYKVIRNVGGSPDDYFREMARLNRMLRNINV